MKIDLIVRGACTLRPGVPGLSENIPGALHHPAASWSTAEFTISATTWPMTVHLASADWMSRNLFRRIEVAFPVLDKTLKRRVITEGLNPYLKDNSNAWELDADGKYHRRRARGKQTEFSAQRYLMELLGSTESSIDH